MADWYGRLMSERVQVDEEFAPRLQESPVTNQQWGLLMTAIEFEIENPERPDEARIVPDLSRVDSVLDQARDTSQTPGASNEQLTDNPGVIEQVKRLLGLSSAEDPMKSAAESLAREYATLLQETLEQQGKWEETCERAAAEQS